MGLFVISYLMENSIVNILQNKCWKDIFDKVLTTVMLYTAVYQCVTEVYSVLSVENRILLSYGHFIGMQ